MYHPIAEELSTSMGTPMEGFFNGADVAFTTPTPFAAAHSAPTEAPTFPTRPVPIDEGTHTGKVNEVTPILVEASTPQKGVTPLAATQPEATPVKPLVISTSDPFTALSQVVKDSSSLVVTPSVLVFATRGPDSNLSSEESKDILEDPDDEPILKKSAPPEAEFMGSTRIFFLSCYPFLTHMHFVVVSVYLYAHLPSYRDL